MKKLAGSFDTRKGDLCAITMALGAQSLIGDDENVKSISEIEWPELWDFLDANEPMVSAIRDRCRAYLRERSPLFKPKAVV